MRDVSECVRSALWFDMPSSSSLASSSRVVPLVSIDQTDWKLLPWSRSDRVTEDFKKDHRLGMNERIVDP